MQKYCPIKKWKSVPGTFRDLRMQCCYAKCPSHVDGVIQKIREGGTHINFTAAPADVGATPRHPSIESAQKYRSEFQNNLFFNGGCGR